MKFRLFQDEYEAFKQKELFLSDQYKEAGKDVGEALQQSSETWHDNAPLDVAKLSWELASRKLKEVQDILSGVQIVKIVSDESIVSMWKRITLSIDGWAELTYVIWWHQTPIEWRVSYNAPLIRPLLWKEEWEVVHFNLNGKNIEVEIIAVEMWIFF